MAFNIPGPAVAMDVPLASLDLWQWATAQENRADVTLPKYLQSVGFVMESDRLTETEYDVLTAALHHWQRTAPHLPGLHRLSDLMAPVKAGGYYLFGEPGRYEPAPRVLTALENAGWIYSVCPETTYFQVAGGKLWAKYQQIIGSRSLAQLID